MMTKRAPVVDWPDEHDARRRARWSRLLGRRCAETTRRAGADSRLRATGLPIVADTSRGEGGALRGSLHLLGEIGLLHCVVGFRGRAGSGR